MPRYPPLGVTAVVDGYRDYLNKVGNMARETERSHSRIGALGRASFGTAIKGAGLLAGAVVGVGAAATAAVGAIAGLGAKLALEAAPLVDFELGFNRLAEAAGRTGGDVLAELQNVSQGTIRAADLMALYNKGVTLLGDEFDNVVPIMGEVIKQGAALGLSPLQSVEDFTTGVARQSKLILDNLGIIVSLDDANEAYATSIGKTVDELSAQERQTALLRAASDQLLNVTEKLPDLNELATANISRMRAQMANTRDEIGKSLVPVLNEFISAISDDLGVGLDDIVTIFKRDFLPTISRIAQFLGANLPKFISFAVEGFRWLGRVVQDVWSFFETFMIPGFNFLYRIFVDKILPILEKVTGFFQNLFETLIDTGTPISQEFTEAMTALVPQSVQDAVFELRRKLIEFYEKAKEWWTTHAPEFKQALIDIKDYIVTEFVPNALEFLAGAFDPVVEGAGKLWEAVSDDIPLIQTRWEELKTTAKDVFDESLPGFIEATQESIETLGEIVGTVLTEMGVKWDEHGGSVINTIFDILEFGITVLIAGLEAVARAVAVILNIIQGDWEEVEELLIAGADRAVNVLSDLLGGTAVGEFLGVPTREEVEEAREQRRGEVVGGGRGRGSGALRGELSEIGQGFVEELQYLVGTGLGSSQPAVAPIIDPATRAATSGAGPQTNFNLTVNTNAPIEPIIEDFEMMSLKAKRIGH